MRPTFRIHTFGGVGVPVDPPPPPASLTEVLTYQKAMHYGAFLAMYGSHIPRVTVAKYLGLYTPTGKPLEVYRKVLEGYRNLMRRLNKTHPVQPPEWAEWIDEMKRELVAFDLLVRTTSWGRLPVIAFAGPDRVGKSTLAAEFQSHMGGRIIGFGDAVKEMAHELGLAENVGRGDKGCWERAAYVSVAQTMREKVDRAYWIKALAPKVDPDRWNIIDDLRFQNEADWVRRMGGIIVRINRPGAQYHKSQRNPFTLSAYSEIPRQTNASKPIIAFLDNDSTFDVFRKRAAELLRYIYRAGSATLAQYQRKRRLE